MSKPKRDWEGELYEIKCYNCKKILTVTLIAEEVIDEETGELKTKFLDEQCECGTIIEYTLQNGVAVPINTGDTTTREQSF